MAGCPGRPTGWQVYKEGKARQDDARQGRQAGEQGRQCSRAEECLRHTPSRIHPRPIPDLPELFFPWPLLCPPPRRSAAEQPACLPLACPLASSLACFLHRHRRHHHEPPPSSPTNTFLSHPPSRPFALRPRRALSPFAGPSLFLPYSPARRGINNNIYWHINRLRSFVINEFY